MHTISLKVFVVARLQDWQHVRSKPLYTPTTPKQRAGVSLPCRGVLSSVGMKRDALSELSQGAEVNLPDVRNERWQKRSIAPNVGV